MSSESILFIAKYFKDTMCGCALYQFHETKMHGQTRRSIQSYYSYNAPINVCSYSLINAPRLEETKQKEIYSIVLVRHHRRSNARSTAFEASTRTITHTLRYTA
jgi:hypothetical protein